MSSSIDSLRAAERRALDLIGSALTSQFGETPMEVQQVVGWPFAWLLHPGIDNRVVVADTRILLRLQQLGLLVITRSDVDGAPQFLTLTELGLRVVLERAQVKRLTDFAQNVLDYGDGAGWY